MSKEREYLKEAVKLIEKAADEAESPEPVQYGARIVSVDAFRSKPDASMSDDMVRVVIDIPKRDYPRLVRYLTPDRQVCVNCGAPVIRLAGEQEGLIEWVHEAAGDECGLPAPK